MQQKRPLAVITKGKIAKMNYLNKFYKFACSVSAIVLAYIGIGFAIEYPEFSCKQHSVGSGNVQISCDLKNRWEYSVSDISIGQNEQGENGSLHGKQPYIISEPAGWKSMFYFEEDTDSYGIFWKRKSKSNEVLPNDSLCCFRVTVTADEAFQFRNAPLKINDRQGHDIHTHVIINGN